MNYSPYPPRQIASKFDASVMVLHHLADVAPTDVDAAAAAIMVVVSSRAQIEEMIIVVVPRGWLVYSTPFDLDEDKDDNVLPLTRSRRQSPPLDLFILNIDDEGWHRQYDVASP